MTRLKPLLFLIAIANFSTAFVFNVFSQNEKFLLPYQSPENPYYWKNNKLLSRDYWQQDVAYTIKASIDDKNDIINADFYQLKYTNNSPAELTELYFHLYDNAYQKDSYYHELWKANKTDPKFGKYEAEKKGIETQNWQVNGQNVKTELDNTIIKISLAIKSW
jgi:hypothetical protein